MTYTESHRRERAAWWNGFLAGSALWAMVALLVVWMWGE